MANDNISEVIARQKEKVRAAVRATVPVILNEAVNFSRECIRKGVDVNGNPFEPRKTNTRKTAGRKLLVQSTRMLNSIQIQQVGDTGGSYGIVGVPYAAIHNNGGVITQSARSETFRRNRSKKTGRFRKGKTAGQGFTFRQRNIRIPQRQFIGKSQRFIDRIQKKGQATFIKAYKAQS